MILYIFPPISLCQYLYWSIFSFKRSSLVMLFNLLLGICLCEVLSNSIAISHMSLFDIQLMFLFVSALVWLVGLPKHSTFTTPATAAVSPAASTICSSATESIISSYGPPPVFFLEALLCESFFFLCYAFDPYRLCANLIYLSLEGPRNLVWLSIRAISLDLSFFVEHSFATYFWPSPDAPT